MRTLLFIFILSILIILYIFSLHIITFIIILLLWFINIDREITVLELDGCNFFSIPDWVFQLLSLKKLNFSKNFLQYIPAEIALLKDLTYVDMIG